MQRLPDDQPQAGTRSAGRDRFTAALRRHGIRGAAAQNVLRPSAELIGMTRRANREFAGAVDVESGAAIGDVLSGASDEIDLSPLLTMMAVSRRHVPIHTHPAGSSFSDADLAVLTEYSAVAAVVVLGGDDTAYVVSKTSAFARLPPQTAMVEYLRANEASFQRYREAVLAWRLTERDAARQHTHAVMRTVARRLGLRYSRIRGVM